jgi:hypothetical protein
MRCSYPPIAFSSIKQYHKKPAPASPPAGLKNIKDAGGGFISASAVCFDVRMAGQTLFRIKNKVDNLNILA